MGGVPSTPRFSDVRPQDEAGYLIGAFVGEKAVPLASDFWQKLLELRLSFHWPSHRIQRACELFAQNNCYTRHLAKILIHLTWCLQECISSSGTPSMAYMKAINAVYFSSVFLKYLIENAQSKNFEELHLSLDESEPIPKEFMLDQNIENLVMHSVLSFIALVDVSPHTYHLHHELLNFMLIAMSTQLLSGPSPGTKDVHPLIDAAMAEESSLVSSVVHRLLLNYITRPCTPVNSASYSIFLEENHPGVLQKVGSAAAAIVLLPFNYLVSSSGEDSKNPLADRSLLVLLVLIHYHKCVESDESLTDRSYDSATSDSLTKSNTHFSDNPYSKALENATDIEFGHMDPEGNAHNGPDFRLPFTSLFDTLGIISVVLEKNGFKNLGLAHPFDDSCLLSSGHLVQHSLCRCLADETAVLLLYSLVQANSGFLEYVLVRTDLDTLLMPMLETLYNASKRTPNQIYMLLIILLILSQDSSFNASIQKIILPSVPWYKEHRLHQTSLGSLLVIILTRTVKYNLSKLRDVYLHTTCLATLANMAPHVHHLSAYASQRLVSLFYMLSHKYNKIADLRDNQKGNLMEQDSLAEDMSAELHIYTDFLRIVLEILNAILTYALPRNPEVVYAILHRQEVFQPFKSHPRFNELLENIYTVLDFFNSRLDAQRVDGEWSVEKVLQSIIVSCRSWRGDGLKMFTRLHFSYEQESHPEEFFTPYVWQLVLSRCGFSFNPSAINLFPVDLPLNQESNDAEEPNKLQNGELKDRRVFIDL